MGWVLFKGWTDQVIFSRGLVLGRKLLLYFILSIPISTFASNYQPLTSPPTEFASEVFQSLSPEEQTSFLTNHKTILQLLNKALNVAQWSYGIGFFAADSYRFIKDTLQDQPHISEEIREMMRQQGFDPENPPRSNYNERTETLNQALLNRLDHFMWERSPFVSSANEFGFMGVISAQAVAGTGNKGWGRIFEIGFSFSFNKQTKGIVLQIFQTTEKFKSSFILGVPSFTAGFGLSFKAGPSISRSNSQLNNIRGSTYYPPNIPGFVQETSYMVATGASSGIPLLFWPPSPIGDIATSLNEIERQILLKFEISPIYKGFLRVSSGLVSLSSLNELRNSLFKLMGKPTALSCSAVFSR